MSEEARDKSPLSRRHAIGVAGVGIAASTLAACGKESGTTATDPGPATSSAGDSPSAPSSAPPEKLTTTADIPEGGGVIFPEQEVVVTQPSAGEFKCFSAVCTHQGCLVTGVTETIDCQCHGSHFSLADGSPVSGPARAPLAEQPITVDGDTITLA